MTTTTPIDIATPTVPVDLIHRHPNNARWDAVADDEMVESIRSIGIAQALTLMPHIGACAEHDVCFTLGAGHRRLDGAVKAGLAEVPVMFREDLVTEAQQLEFMLVENLHRADLSPAEEAAAYEQLTLFGHDVDAIAAATGRSKSTIRARLKLTKLPQTSFSLVHEGQMTLADAEALLEFADDPSAVEELEEAAGSGNFAWKVKSLRDLRDRAARHQERIDEFEAAGASRWEKPNPDEPLMWSKDTVCPLTWFRLAELREPADHTDCLGYFYAGPASYSDPVLVCTAPAGHDDEPPVDPEAEAARASRDAQFERDRADREARAARRAASRDARIEWLVDHYQAMFPVKSHQPLASAAKALLPLILTDTDEVVDDGALLAALGTTPEDRSYAAVQRARALEADEVASAKPTAVLAVFAAVLAAMTSERLDVEPSFIDDPDQARRVLDLWDWLKGAGYQLSDVDKEIRAELEVRHTELGDDSERR